jgi:putative membrane protein
MRFSKSQWIILIFTLLYTCGFGFYYLTSLNFEFIAYTVLVLGIFAVLYGTLHITQFPNYIIGALSFWGLLHMMGGSVQTADGVLYAYRIIPLFDGGGEFYILKFDQLVHGFLYAFVALMFLHLFRKVLGIREYPVFMSVVAVFAATGVSVLNEIIEFAAVVIAPETGVGGYFNTVLDLIFNFTGAAVAVGTYWTYKWVRRFGPKP